MTKFDDGLLTFRCIFTNAESSGTHAHCFYDSAFFLLFLYSASLSLAHPSSVHFWGIVPFDSRLWFAAVAGLATNTFCSESITPNDGIGF